jgi:GDP-L-fucose synthase
VEIQVELDSKIFVAGHRGLVGSAIVRKLNKLGYTNIITRTRREVDLMDSSQVKDFFDAERPEYVFLAAARVGGIFANDNYSAEFIYENIQIQNNVIHFAYSSGVKKLLFLGSNCIYPKFADQPIKEEYLLTGTLEPTNDAYAIAKIAGIQMCQSYRKQYGFNCISLMPANMYGPNDNFNQESSHVFAAMIRKFEDARVSGSESVTLFGDGSPMREFLYCDDLASACVFLMNNYDDPMPINVSSDDEYSIKEIAEIIKDAVGYTGEITWDTNMPNGTPRKKLDLTRIHSLGWKSEVSLSEGARLAIDWYQKTGGVKNEEI